MSVTPTVVVVPSEVQARYRAARKEAAAIVELALAFRDRLLELDRQNDRHDTAGDVDYAAREASGSDACWSTLADGLMAVVYG